MITTNQHRLLVLSLLLFVGLAGAVGYAVSNSTQGGDKTATPAAQNPPSGTGTVVGAKPTDPPGNAGSPGPSGVFSISGTVGGLVPGAASTLHLTVSNPNPWPIQVLTLNTGVGAPNGSPCPASTLQVGDYTWHDGDAVVKAQAKSTVVVDVPVQLVDSLTQNQSGCPASTFPLTYTGTAVKTSR